LLFPKLATPTNHDAKYVADNANGFFSSEMHLTVLFPESRRVHHPKKRALYFQRPDEKLNPISAETSTPLQKPVLLETDRQPARAIRLGFGAKHLATDGHAGSKYRRVGG
jgi:hypothetical protein